jgi:hypothetical protein
MERQLTRLTATVEAGFQETYRRFDRQDERLELIDSKAASAHSRVSRIEGTVRSLSARIEDVAKKMHGAMAEAQRWVADVYLKSIGEPPPPPLEAPDETRRALTLQGAMIWIGVIIATVTSTYMMLVGPFGFHK